MTRPIRNELDLVAIAVSRRGRPFVEMLTDRFDDGQIASLASCTDVVSMSRRPAFEDGDERPGMVVDIEPIANVLASAVDGQRTSKKRIGDGQRDQLLRELIGAIVIAAIGEQHRHAIGAVPRQGEVIRCSLASRVRRSGIVRRGFGERALVAQAAKHFVGRDVEEAECALSWRRQTFPITARRFEQVVGPDNIGGNEVCGFGDRAIDVGFCCKVQHGVRMFTLEHDLQSGPVADVQLAERIARILSYAFERIEICCIGQLVYVYDGAA